MRCPQCHEHFTDPQCDCGFKNEKDLENKSMVSITLRNGEQVMITKCCRNGCEKPGTMSKSIARGLGQTNWLCAKHYEE